MFWMRRDLTIFWCDFVINFVLFLKEKSSAHYYEGLPKMKWGTYDPHVLKLSWLFKRQQNINKIKVIIVSPDVFMNIINQINWFLVSFYWYSRFIIQNRLLPNMKYKFIKPILELKRAFMYNTIKEIMYVQ